jgi:hypothetical protein
VSYDFFGLDPDEEAGRHFVINMWGWRPLKEFLDCSHRELSWELELACGDQVAESLACRTLGQALMADVSNGVATKFIEANDRLTARLPDVQCYCKSGENGKPAPDCRNCQGTGWKRPIDAWYSVDLETIEEFATLIEHCGGFRIWCEEWGCPIWEGSP